MKKLKKNIKIFCNEIKLLLQNLQIPFILGNQDISSRYKRSKIGAFWITINLLIFIITLSLVFGHLFKNRIEIILPTLATGLIAWNYISSLLGESSVAFSSSSSLILQTNIPILSHLIRVWWRNTIIFLHNLLIIPIIYIFFDISFNSNFFYFILSFVLLNFMLIGPCLILSVISTRYRDVSNLLNNLLQISFYLTPILWSLENINSTTFQKLIFLNPFFYPVTMVQKSLLSFNIDLWIFLISGSIGFIFLFFGVLIFGLYRKRIPFWL